jgi:hypothetical protein
MKRYFEFMKRGWLGEMRRMEVYGIKTSKAGGCCMGEGMGNFSSNPKMKF